MTKLQEFSLNNNENIVYHHMKTEGDMTEKDN